MSRNPKALARTRRVRRLTPVTTVRRTPPTPTGVYDTFWHFACERQRVFYRRLEGQPAPWTIDPILQSYRFTNAYRASDRVSQYLIRNVIYRSDLPSTTSDILFRILLFKLFNRIETWEYLEYEFGALTLDKFRFEDFAERLTKAQRVGRRLYSAAYIMPSTGSLGERTKHRGHLRLIERMMQDGIGTRLPEARSMGDVFQLLLSYPTLGPFLAFQLAIDFNYSSIIDFSEMDFVAAGPGAADGLRKCFASFGDYAEADVIRWVTDRQEDDPARLGLRFPTLYERPLQLVDVQNLFCEVSKYARVAHPDVRGTNGRSRIKQTYCPSKVAPRLFYPPKWGINLRIPGPARTPKRIPLAHVAESLFA